MDTNSYVAFLSLGVLLVLADGLILYRSGLRYLGSAYQADNARGVMQLVIVLFHLVVLGVLALISTIDVATGLPARDLVVKLGIVLLTLGVAHGVTMAILKTVRDRRRDEQIIEEEMSVDRTTIHPATDQR
jgi:hypothetical protein